MAHNKEWNVNRNSFLWPYFILEEWPNAKCNICDKRFHGGQIVHLENHLSCVHPEIIEKIRNEIRGTWLSEYFTFVEDCSKVRCIINNCIINIFRGINHLTDHLFKKHNLVDPNNNVSAGGQRPADIHLQAAKGKRSGWNSNSMVLQYFTLDEWPYAKCNICDKCFHGGQITHLERHLSRVHAEIVEKIRNEISDTWLSEFFTFDEERRSKTRCIIDDCIINVYYGINHLTDHLFMKHNIVEPNNNVSIGDQRSAGTHLQAAKRKRRSKWNSNSIVLQYFTSDGWPNAKCNICDKRSHGGQITHLEKHLSCVHPEIIEKIRNEISDTWLSEYFKFDEERRSRTRCIIDDCIINIYYGINYLTDHLYIKHNIVELNNNVSAGDQRSPGTYLPAAKRKRRSEWNSNSMVLQYFTLNDWPNAKCNTCNKRFHGGRLMHLERHLSCVHPEIIETIRNEIKGTWLSEYFTFDEECSKVRCIINDCIINIFRGINHLTDHLFKKHNIVEPNSNVNADDQRSVGTHLQAGKRKRSE